MITAEHCRGARAILNWSQEQLASAANVGLSTVRDFEKGRHTPQLAKMDAIEDALKSANINFVTYANGAIGVFHGPVDLDHITASEPGFIQARLRALQEELRPVTDRIINGSHSPEDLDLNNQLQAEIAELVDKLKALTPNRPKLLRRKYNVENRAVHFYVEYKGQQFRTILPVKVLEDWHRTRFRDNDEIEAAFDRQINTILVRVRRASDAGRIVDENLALTKDDFPDVG